MFPMTFPGHSHFFERRFQIWILDPFCLVGDALDVQDHARLSN